MLYTVHTHGWRLHGGTLEGNIQWPEAVTLWFRQQALPSGLPASLCGWSPLQREHPQTLFNKRKMVTIIKGRL